MINEKMAQDLINLGIKKDDTILMHSSLSSLGYIEGGAETVIDTILSVLTEGTLLIPALSYSYVNNENPVFNIKETGSCVGIISETFRKRDGVIRSMHPTHSVCGTGKYAAEILSKHIETNTPAGKTSPFALLPKYNGKILMLGCGLNPNTSMHGVEELTKPWYLLTEEPFTYTLTDENGNETKKDYFRHNFHASNAHQRYDRLADVMNLECKKVLNADCYLIDAKKMWETADKYIKENNNYFIDTGETK